MNPVLFLSGKRPLLLRVLVALTGVSLVALIALGWRSLNRFETTVSRVLREACAYAAQDSAQQIQRDFKSPVFTLLGQIDHAAIQNYRLEEIAETLRRRAQQFSQIDTFFVWSRAPEDGPASGAVSPERPLLLYEFASRASLADKAATPAALRASGFFVQSRLAPMLHERALSYAKRRKNYAVAYVAFEGRTYHVVYHFLFDEGREWTLRAYEGFLSDIRNLRHTYFGELRAKWQHDKMQSADAQPLAISVVDDQGVEVVRSGRSLARRYDGEARFPLLFFDTDLFDSLSPYRPEVRYWTIRTGYEAGDIANIVRRQSALQRGSWLLVGLVTLVGMVAIARAMTHEARLVQMQADFVANVSHDLKTPLAKIQLFAETLAAGRAKTPAKAAIYQQRITVQAKKLGQLIGALLDFNRFEAGVGQYPLEELDLRDALRSAIEFFDDELSQHNCTVEVAMPNAAVLVLANSGRLQQLFGNLISNALKYSPAEKYLRISLATADDRAIVELTDRGIGIPRSEQRKIFRKFYRGSRAVAMGMPGSGLGLAIVEHVVRAHGGKIGVTSAPGEGSTFRVELPLIAAVEDRGIA